MKSIRLPMSEENVRALRAGDYVLLQGTLFTARDAVHKYLAEGNPPPCDLNGSVIYHCGPVSVQEHGKWQVTAAGPTTSIREEPYMGSIIAACGVRGIIGKGGMGSQTLAACQHYGCVYFHAVGGAARVLAKAIREVRNVYWADKFGLPEAIWELAVTDFPVTVTMDSHGCSMHGEVERASGERLKALLGAGQ